MLIRFDNGLTTFSHNQLYGRWFTVPAYQYPDNERQLRLAIEHTSNRSALLCNQRLRYPGARSGPAAAASVSLDPAPDRMCWRRPVPRMRCCSGCWPNRSSTGGWVCC